MEITARPPLFSATGGRMPNPVTYTIATASAYVEATLYKEDGSLISTVKASARNGVAILDVSSFLRSQMSLAIPVGAIPVEVTAGSSLGFYCTFEDAEGQTLNDSANVRYAVAAALPAGTSDYSGYSVI